jgi:hypothetical protein
VQEDGAVDQREEEGEVEDQGRYWYN